MKLVQPSATLHPFNLGYKELLTIVANAVSLCYKVEKKDTIEGLEKFVKARIDSGHVSVIEHGNITVEFLTDRGCCYDKDTLVLTRDGWKYFYECNVNDFFYTMTKNGDIRFEKAVKFIRKKVSEELDHYRNTQIDLLVTKNHNMWVYDYDKRSEETRTWKFLKSEELTNGRYLIDKSSNGIDMKGFNYITIPSREWTCKISEGGTYDANYFFELLGYWITDGSISHGSRYAIITQTKKDNVKRIKYLLKKLNITFYEKKDTIVMTNVALHEWLKDNFIKGNDYKKSYYVELPNWIFTECSKINLEFLLKGIISGNGTKHTKGKGFQIYTASEQFAKDMVRLSLHIGKSANYYIIPRRDRTYNGKKWNTTVDEIVVSIIETTKTLIHTRKSTKHGPIFSKEFYNDYVYCVELPKYHRLYVMRNGKACWCGNSHELVRHRLASYTQESTRYCNYSKGKFDNQLTFIIPEWMAKDCDVNKISGRWVYDFDYDNLDALIQKNVNILSTGSFDGYIFYRMINGQRKDEVEVSQLILEYIDDMLHTESMYMEFINKGMKPEDARGRLTNDLAANIIMTANIREWRHVLSLRSLGTTGRPHPNIKVIMDSLLKQLATTYPIFFADLLKSSTEMN